MPHPSTQTAKIDLHQDLILSFRHDTTSFFEYQDTYHDLLGTNAGNFSDYITTGLNMILGVIWPYHIGTHGANGNITYDASLIPSSIQRYKNLQKHGDISLVLSHEDLKRQDALRILLHIEWCDHCQHINDITDLYNQGIRSIWFVRNFNNHLSQCNTSSWGLTRFGYEAIEYMNHHWMIIDTAHMNHQAMMETLATSQKPIINSHSNLQHFQKHPRNVYDEFVIQLANAWGVLWLSMCSDFISGEGNIAYIQQYIDQIAYIINIAWQDCVCFWSDFHGILQDKETIQEFWKIASVARLEELITDKFWREFSQKFFKKNALRVIRASLASNI